MKKIFDPAIFLLFFGFKALFSIFPRTLCLTVGRFMGLMFYLIDSRHRQIALTNLAIAFQNEKPHSERKAIAKDSFKHFGEVIMDLIKFTTLSEKNRRQLVRVEGEENIQKALEEKKGALLLTGHYGNWEIAPHSISRLGNLKVIARPLDNIHMERELLKMRRDLGEDVIDKKKAARDVLKALHRNAMVAILIDQNVLKNEAVFIDFFGRAAATTPGLAVFHIRTGSPLIPVFSFPAPNHIYQIKIFPPLQVPLSGQYREDILKITQICTKMIEDQIRRHPKYWLWFHNRWKTRPEEEYCSLP
jgi:KDO2-lipid IV(A) lauroyltransferase